MKLAINNVNVVTLEKVIYGGSVTVEDGVITAVLETPSSAETVIDGKGSYLIPGFIDIHCHGGWGYDFTDCNKEEMAIIAKNHLEHGTTTMVATTLTARWNILENSLKTFKEYKEENPDSPLVGVHMEGPWFSPAQSGAQDPSYMRDPSADDIKKLKSEYPFLLRVSAAPEIDKDMQFGKACVELGVVASAGHTDADFECIEKAYENGYKLLTHFYSGMKGVTRVNAYRVAGAVEAGYYIDGMDVEIIADGRHLPYTLLKLIYKLKGADKVSLITDATRGCGFPDGTESFIGAKEDPMPIVIKNGVAFMADGQAFAGSTATYDRLYRTMAEAVGKDMVALSKMTATNPARIMNLTDRGEIKVGKRADLIVMNENLKIEKILLKGNIVK